MLTPMRRWTRRGFPFDTEIIIAREITAVQVLAEVRWDVSYQLVVRTNQERGWCHVVDCGRGSSKYSKLLSFWNSNAAQLAELTGDDAGELFLGEIDISRALCSLQVPELKQDGAVKFPSFPGG
jgi:hypothetical protein